MLRKSDLRTISTGLKACQRSRHVSGGLGSMKRKFGEFGGFYPFLNHLLDGQRMFGLLDGVESAARIRMRWDKQRTTILVRFDGRLKRSDVLSFIGDFDFIHTDQWAENRQMSHLAHDLEVLRGLGGDLSEAVTGDQAPAAFFFGQLFRNAHHHAPVQDDANRRGRAHDDLALNLSKRNEVATSRQLIAREQGDEVADFFFGGS